MKIAVLTGGGDCPGLNAAIRAVARKAAQYGHRVTGIREGWYGLYTRDFIPIDSKEISGLLTTGGTILGGSRDNPLKFRDGLKKCLTNFKSAKFDAIISIGGEGTLKIAQTFSEKGVPVISVPKTIDNDTWGTDTTIGFDTAVQIATEAIDRLQTTAESHDRVMIVEVMGRHAGWIAALSGIAGGADAILIPEKPFAMEDLLSIIRGRAKRGKHFTIIVAAEDAKISLKNGKILQTPLQKDEYGDVKVGGIGELLAKALRRNDVPDVRVTVLGHVQRGGTPTAADRILATCLGVHAVELAHQKKFGRLVCARGGKFTSIPMKRSAGKMKRLDPTLFKIAELFFG